MSADVERQTDGHLPRWQTPRPEHVRAAVVELLGEYESQVTDEEARRFSDMPTVDQALVLRLASLASQRAVDRAVLAERERIAHQAAMPRSGWGR